MRAPISRLRHLPSMRLLRRMIAAATAALGYPRLFFGGSPPTRGESVLLHGVAAPCTEERQRARPMKDYVDFGKQRCAHKQIVQANSCLPPFPKRIAYAGVRTSGPSRLIYVVRWKHEGEACAHLKRQQAEEILLSPVALSFQVSAHAKLKFERRVL